MYKSVVIVLLSDKVVENNNKINGKLENDIFGFGLNRENIGNSE